jgi:hypothetical protein
MELIMTMVVMGLACMPLALLIRGHIDAAQASTRTNAAVHLARLEMETVNALSFGAVTSSQHAKYRGFPYDVYRSVSYVYGNDAAPEALKKVIVEVRPSGEKTPVVSLITYIARNVAYGP